MEPGDFAKRGLQRAGACRDRAESCRALLDFCRVCLAPAAALVLAVARKVALAHFIALSVLLWYKSTTLLYPPGAAVQEAAVLILLFVLQSSRLSFGSRGQKIESAHMLAVFIWLTLPAAVLIGYHLNFQVYVLRIEELVCTISLCDLGLEGVLSLALGFRCAESLKDKIMLASGFMVLLAALAFAVSFDGSLA